MSDTSARHKRLVAHSFIFLLTLLAASVCLLLGWWQWNRFHGTGGSFQNLGYALQWPFFALFALYGYFRFIALVKDQDQGKKVTPTSRFSDAMPSLPPAAPIAELGPHHSGLKNYNAMLAELASTTERSTQ